MTTATVTTRTERTQRAILKAADACFREFGYDAAKSTEIARRAAVAEGTVFLHYGSKAGLLTAVTREFYDVIQTEAERELETPGDPAARLRRLVDRWASRVESDWSLISVFTQRSQMDRDSELSQTMFALNRRYTRLFVGVIRELQAEGSLRKEIPAVLVRDIISGTLEHTARGQSNTGKRIRVRGAGQQMIDMLLSPPRNDSGKLDLIESKIDDILRRLPPSD
jgi:AcrR family transcriptional regulator